MRGKEICTKITKELPKTNGSNEEKVRASIYIIYIIKIYVNKLRKKGSA